MRNYVDRSGGGSARRRRWRSLSRGCGELTVVDDDVVETSNLHRQILFDDSDVGRHKLDALAAALQLRFANLRLRLIRQRALPHTVADIVAESAVVVDATDNFASRFLLADAAFLAGVPIVHAAAVRWQATVMPVRPEGRPCYRCLFEDLPSGPVADCATAGVMGPVCAVSGAIAADRALQLMAGERGAGHIVTYDGLRDRLPRGARESTGRLPSVLRRRYHWRHRSEQIYGGGVRGAVMPA